MTDVKQCTPKRNTMQTFAKGQRPNATGVRTYDKYEVWLRIGQFLKNRVTCISRLAGAASLNREMLASAFCVVRLQVLMLL